MDELPSAEAPTDAELRAMLLDCVRLWGVTARVTAVDDGLSIAAESGVFLLRRAPIELRPVRWLLQTPERRLANRPERALPSVVALLTTLRNALGAEAGNKLKVGTPAA